RRADQVGEHHCDLPSFGSICGRASRRDDRCETDRLCSRSERTNNFQELETSTKRKTHLAEMILREIVQDVGVDRVLAEYRLILFEAKALQPTSDVHDGALTSARRTLSKHADAPQALLRARRERPCRRAAEQRDELAAPHSITSSARASSVGGTSRPSARGATKDGAMANAAMTMMPAVRREETHHSCATIDQIASAAQVTNCRAARLLGRRSTFSRAQPRLVQPPQHHRVPYGLAKDHNKTSRWPVRG